MTHIAKIATSFSETFCPWAFRPNNLKPGYLNVLCFQNRDFIYLGTI